MWFESIVNQSQLFLLIFARIFAMIQVAPMLSSRAIPQIAKIALGFFAAVCVLPWVSTMGYVIPQTGLGYAFFLIGEVLVGITIGFLVDLIYSVFQSAGQFFSLEMGFGASEVFDPLSQIELPIMGQFLNLIAMYVFISTKGLQKLFLTGVLRSFEALKAPDFFLQKEHLVKVIFRGIGGLFEQALVISMPVLGALFIVSIAMGLLAKAAPQMNLLMMGFPIQIGVAFLLLFLVLPFLMEAFEGVIDGGFTQLVTILDRYRTGVTR